MSNKEKTLPQIQVLMIGGPDVDSRIPLIRQLNDQYSISVLGSNPSLANAFDRAGIGYLSYPLNRGANPLSDISTMRHLAAIISQIHPDIVHTFDTKPAVWGRLAAKWAGVRHIMGTLPGLGLLYSEDTLGTRVVRRFYQPLQKMACAISDATIFQNSEDAEQFMQAGIVSPDKVVILPGSGVETRFFDPRRFSAEDRKRFRANLNINDSQIVIIMITRLIRSKGVLEFADAAQAVQQQFPGVIFLLIGPDDKASADALTPGEIEQVRKSVLWLGARDDISELLALSDIFVLPSFYREGMPRVLLEAASMGLPIVTTDAPGCKEVVEVGMNGFLIPPRDVHAIKEAVVRLVLDAEMRCQFGAQSRKRTVDHFDLSLIAKQTASIYGILLAQKNQMDAHNV